MQNIRTEATPYADLSPDCILNAVDKLGYRSSGALFALNSYENRVYDVGMDDKSPNIIAKFYRPHRWTREQILEEHAFSLNLKEAEIDTVAPLVRDGETLFEHEGYLYALFPKRHGRMVAVQSEEDFKQMGRLVARVHSVGAWSSFQHRQRCDVETLGLKSLRILENKQELLPETLRENVLSTTRQVLETCQSRWQNTPFSMRLHGDCHLGNVLDDGCYFLVDLDDCMSGPEVQDVWMMLSGEGESLQYQLEKFMEGYEQIRAFPYEQLPLMDVLRTLRQIYYAAWLANRWQDPTFPKAFPFFAEEHFWAQYLAGLRDQMALLQSGRMSWQNDDASAYHDEY